MNVPSWYGLGTAFDAIVSEEDVTATQRVSAMQLQDLYLQSSAFKLIIDNANQELARCRLEISRLYITRAYPELFDEIEDEFARSVKWILCISQQKNLLDNNPVIQRSIKFRKSIHRCVECRLRCY